MFSPVITGRGAKEGVAAILVLRAYFSTRIKLCINALAGAETVSSQC
jgi:hypothetical protein